MVIVFNEEIMKTKKYKESNKMGIANIVRKAI